MLRKPLSQKFISPPDVLILMLIGTLIYSIVAVTREYPADFHPITQIDLSIRSLPLYTLLSAVRGSVAYLISLVLTLIVGYAAAKSKSAERIIIPMIDVLQSIPALGFLPGLTLALISLFPHSNLGLELVAIIMIFTSQAWNMMLSFYSSLKSIPPDLADAATIMGLSRRQRLLRLELPFSAVDLAWNSLLSMAGGWFFLTVCEANKIGDREFRLPGIGSYMAVAIAKDDHRAMVFGVLAMIILIVTMDFLIWRPILSWIRRFRTEDLLTGPTPEPLMRFLVRESRILRWLKVEFRRYAFRKRHQTEPVVVVEPEAKPASTAALQEMWQRIARQRHDPRFLKWTQVILATTGAFFVFWGAWRLGALLLGVHLNVWAMILRNALWTLLRVFLSVVLSSIWAVPVGIWIGTSERRIRIAQPIVQVLASFPAPMLYPLALTVLFAIGMGFEWASMILMFLGAQWYVLFNVLAGALRIPRELRYVQQIVQLSRWDRWKTLYLPTVFPSLVNGWMIAAGGAWNASIVAEYVAIKGGVLKATGLGAMIVLATDAGDLQLLAASLSMMVALVLLLNRLVWLPAYAITQRRYRLDV